MLVGSTVNNPAQVLSMLEESIPVHLIYILCVHQRPGQLFEIMHAPEFFKPYQLKRRYQIVGFANGKAEAYSLAASLIAKYFTRYHRFVSTTHFHLFLQQESECEIEQKGADN